MANAGTPTAAATASSGNWWDPLIQVGAEILGNVVQGSIANNGINKQTDAQTAANQQAIALQKQIYQDQVARTEPWRKSGFNALNFLNQWNGLPQVTDTGGNALGTSSNLASNGTPLLPNYGAGLPVAGHTGGGGYNPLYSSGGQLLGGPIGGFIGSLIRPGGDNWTTLATQAPAGYDYNAYMAQNPGLAAEWAKPDVQSLFGGNRDAYAYWHYNTFGPSGKNEGWVLNPLPSSTGATTASNGSTTQPVGGATQQTPATGTSTSGTPDLWSTIRNNPLYVAATQGFLGVNGQGGDVSKVNAAFSTNGQALSGAKLKALQDFSTSKSYGALSDIYGNYAKMAGVGSETAGAQNQNAGQYATNTGNTIIQNGNILGQAAGAKNANWANVAANAIGAGYDYGKSQGWFGA